MRNSQNQAAAPRALNAQRRPLTMGDAARMSAAFEIEMAKTVSDLLARIIANGELLTTHD